MISEYHFHIYFSAASRPSAETLRRRLGEQREFTVATGPLRDAPAGPHPTPQFQAVVLAPALEAAVRWFMLEHGEHPVLLHPNSGHDVIDHTARAFWLGEPVTLDHSKFDSP